MRMRCRLGFSILEVTIVAAIIAILSAIAYPVFRNVREKGIEKSCQLRLKQIYSAITLYGADYPGYEPMHPEVDLPAFPMRRQTAFAKYLKKADMLKCPATPPCAASKLFNTYIFSALPLNAPPSWQRQFDSWFKNSEKGYPIVHCLVHDELFYFPGERHLSERLNPPFMIRLLPSGGTVAGRYPLTRGHDIARECR